MSYEIALLFCFISIVTYSLYMVALKPAKKRLLVFFWVNVFGYFGYLALYFFRKTVLEHDVHAIEELLYDFTFTNVPLYMLMALCWVGSLILLNALLDRFDVSLVVPVTEVGIVFTTAGYLALGNQFSWIVLASVFVVLVGAIISGMQTFTLSNPFKDLKKIPPILLAGGVLQAFFESAAMLVTFLCTHKTIITEEILMWLQDMFHHIYAVPFSFHQAFYYNVGVRFFITLFFLLYLLIFRNHRWDIITEVYNNPKYILGVSCIFLVAIVTYHMAYQDMPDKNVLAALRKLTIPTILGISYYTLGEKITRPKVIGCVVIVIGGMMSLLA